MDDKLHQDDAIEPKHEEARRLAEAAVEAQAAGDDDRADALMDKASRTDPEVVAEVLEEQAAETIPDPEIVVQDDAEIAAISRTIEPGSAAPSRAGITGAGSGADSA